MVVAVVRDDRLVVPRGDTMLQSGDEVLVLVTADAEDAVHALFIAETDGLTATVLQPRDVPGHAHRLFAAASSNRHDC